MNIEMESSLDTCTFDSDGNVTNGPVDTKCVLPICNGSNGSWDAGTCKKAVVTLSQVEESWVPVVVKSTGPLPVCTGTNGLDGTNCARAVCSGTNGPMDGPSGTACTREEPAAIPHYNTEPTAGQPYQTSGNITPSHPSVLDPAAPISAALL